MKQKYIIKSRYVYIHRYVVYVRVQSVADSSTISANEIMIHGMSYNSVIYIVIIFVISVLYSTIFFK